MGYIVKLKFEFRGPTDDAIINDAGITVSTVSVSSLVERVVEIDDAATAEQIEALKGVMLIPFGFHFVEVVP
jgi:hypothetical protein